jgi:hypothetical protein
MLRLTIAVTLVIAAALLPSAASAQVDQEITRSQANTIARAIENNLPPATPGPTDPRCHTATAAPPPYSPAAQSAGRSACATSAPPH